MIRTLILSFFSVLILTGCSDEDTSRDIRHYYYPSWSHDGSLLIAAYESGYGDIHAPRPEPFQLALRDNNTFSEKIIPIKPGILSSRYYITPENNAIAVVRDGLEFYDLNGNLIDTYESNLLNSPPQALTFSADEKAYLWATLSGATVHIIRTTYGENAWDVDHESIIQSFPASSEPIDIKATNQNSIVVALSEGRILEFPFVGSLQYEVSYTPFTSDNPWLQRIEYTFDDRANANYVYTLNDSGLVRFDLTNNHDSLVVNGMGINGQGRYVVGFDAEDANDVVVFEVSDGDIHNYKPALFRRAAAHRMPKFSPNGKRLAAVAYINPGEDSLHVL